jgi:hypothetical protein
MSIRKVAILVFGSLMLYCQDVEWTGEHRAFKNMFYISPWPENTKEAVQITRQQVVEFLSHVGNPAFKDESDLQEFQFASLAKGRMHLVAVIQSGGTIGANTVVVAHCDAVQCVEDYIESTPPIDLASLLVSVRDDGTKQLLIVEPLVALDSGVRAVGAYDLYELGPKGLERATEKYRDEYVKTVRPLLEAQQAEAAGERTDERKVSDKRLMAALRDGREFRRAAADYALALFNDRMGLTTHSLVEHAVKWSRSDVRDVQALAVSALRHVPNSNVRQQLLEELKKSDKVKHLLDGVDSIKAAK